MTTDFRALCAELIASWDADGCDWKPQHQARWEATVNRARAALADEPPDPPLYARQTGIGQWEGADHPSGPWRKVLPADLARWGNPAPPPPADGEVAELVTELQSMATDADKRCRFSNAERLSRAAELLERLSPPQPVPVSERPPGPGDCTTNPRTGEGQWCWGWVQHDPIPYSGRWRMIRREWLVDEAKAWLPAHALPLPEVGE